MIRRRSDDTFTYGCGYRACIINKAAVDVLVANALTMKDVAKFISNKSWRLVTCC
ncbi:hypothetical protein SP19_144 [Salmonella phage 19]|nr:hypothetical protein SP19_144 [Salmonella phage 19]